MTVTPQQLYTFRSSYTTLTYSKDDLRGLIAQIEESFTHSDIYIRALKRLQDRLGSQANGLQLLVNALGREAIRLTLRELISTVTNAPSTASASASAPATVINATSDGPPPTFTIPAVQHNSPQNSSVPTSEPQPQSGPQVGMAIAIPDHPVLADEGPIKTVEEIPIIETMTATSVATGEEVPVATAIAPPVTVPSNPPHKNIPRKPRPQPSTDREIALSSIGQALYEARCQKNLAIEQLHQRTCVPIHHIRALEDGIWQNLPEDIYLKGFIRLLGNAVDLNGHDLSQQLSGQSSTSTNGPLPLSRATTKVSSNHQPSQLLHQTHLYLGYAALMAGATGGLAWMVSQPSTVQGSMVGLPDTPNEMSLRNQHNPNQGSLKVFADRIFEQINAIAQPETLPPETPPSQIKP